MGVYGKYINQDDILNEKFTDDIKKKITDTKELKEQWKKVADKFVKHKWLYRYINEEQKEQLKKHYANLVDENVSYSDYKKSFKFISKFMGLPHDKIMIETMTFEKDKKDKEQEIVALRYSKGLAKVVIPEGVKLIHVSPADNITELIPSFRSKVKGKYMYPNKRCFFTVARDISAKKAGLEGEKITRYTPKTEVQYAYIDPTCSDFKLGSVYIESDSPIPVVNYTKKILGIFNRKKNNEEEEQ